MGHATTAGVLLLFVLGTVMASMTGMDSNSTSLVKKNGTNTQEASGLELVSNDTVGEDMFQMSGDNGSSSITFGFAKIIEVNSTGGMINVTGHKCNFMQHNVTCTTGEEEQGSLEALDAYGNSTSANYTMVSRTCDLSVCNTNANASLVVKTYIMLNKAYICQPNCTYNDSYQSPVFNGTAKWEIEISNWTFCENGTSGCGGKIADKLKIFFSLGGKEGGKEMKPEKKEMEPFDREDDRFSDMCGSNNDSESSNSNSNGGSDSNSGGGSDSNSGGGSDSNSGGGSDSNSSGGSDSNSSGGSDSNSNGGSDSNSNGGSNGSQGSNSTNGSSGSNSGGPNSRRKRSGQSGNSGSNSTNSDSGSMSGNNSNSTDSGSGSMSGNNSNSTNSNSTKGMREDMGNREGKGKCRNALSSSFGDEPDDQDSFSFSDGNSTNSTTTFRMFGMAVLDDGEVVANGTGFDGPNVEEEEVEMGGSTMQKEYITISVNKFEKKMVYDPTGDTDEDGGTTGDDESSSGTRNVASVVLVSLVAAFIYQFVN